MRLLLSASFLVRLFYRSKRCAAAAAAAAAPGYIKFISGEQTRPGDYAPLPAREKIEAAQEIACAADKGLRCREKQVPY